MKVGDVVEYDYKGQDHNWVVTHFAPFNNEGMSGFVIAHIILKDGSVGKTAMVWNHAHHKESRSFHKSQPSVWVGRNWKAVSQ